MTADLQIFKTTPTVFEDNGVAPGGTISYTLLVRNVGTTTEGDSDPVVVRDTLPTGFSLTNVIAGGGFIADTETEIDDGIISFTAPSFGTNGVAFFTINGIVSQGASDSITNQAGIDPDNLIFEGADESNNTDTVVTTVNSSLGPDLEVFKSGDDEVLSEGTITYSITVRNIGEGNATDIVVRDILPTDFSLVEVISGDGFIADTSTDGEISFTGGFLDSGEIAQFTVTGTAPTTTEDLTLTNTITVDPDDEITESDEDNNDDMVVTTVTVEDPPPELTPDLVIFKSADTETVAAGDTLTYTIIVRNDGEGDATDIEVLDTLPDNFSLASVTSGGDFTADTLTEGEVSFTGGNLDSGELAILTIEGIVQATTSPLTNVAVVDPDDNIVESNDMGDAEDNNTATATTNVGLSDLVIFKIGQPSQELAIGETITYTIIVRNDGEAAADNITVEDDLPSDFLLDAVVAGDGFTADTSISGEVTFTGGFLDVDEIAILTIEGRATAGGSLVNTAVVDPDDEITESEEGNNTATFTSGAEGPTLVFVDDDWEGLAIGTPVDTDGDTINDATIGINAFPTIDKDPASDGIGGGLNRVGSGGTVQVFAGDYDEIVFVTKPVSLIGPQAGVPGSDASRTPSDGDDGDTVNEAILTGAATGIEFLPGANEGAVIVDGFRLDGPGAGPGEGAAIDLQSSGANTTIINNILRDLDGDAIRNFPVDFPDNIDEASNVTIENNLIEDITDQVNGSGGGNSRAIFLQEVNGLTITGNVIRDVTDGDNPGILLDTVTGDVLVQNNTLTNIASQGIQVAGIGDAGGTVTIDGNQLTDINVGADITNAGIRLRDAPPTPFGSGEPLNNGTVIVSNNRVENTLNGLVIRNNTRAGNVTVTSNFFVDLIENTDTTTPYPDSGNTLSVGTFAIIHDGRQRLDATGNFNNTISDPLTDSDVLELNAPIDI